MVEPGVLGDGDGDGKPDYDAPNLNPWSPVYPWTSTTLLMIH